MCKVIHLNINFLKYAQYINTFDWLKQKNSECIAFIEFY